MSENLLTPDQAKIEEARGFISEFSSVILGTVSNEGRPHTSYAPTITDQGHYYVFVSGLAQHTKTLGNGHASLFFVQDEQQAKTIFARTRFTIDCTSTVVENNTERYQTLLNQFQSRHGSTIKLLRTLPDFVMFELQPQSASFVTGFGAAYDFTPHVIDII